MPDEMTMGESTEGERTTEPAFEDLLEQLEGMVGRLEKGNLPLGDALDAFERGMTLADEADKRLAEGEARVEALIKGAGGEDEVHSFDEAFPSVDIDRG